MVKRSCAVPSLPTGPRPDANGILDRASLVCLRALALVALSATVATSQTAGEPVSPVTGSQPTLVMLANFTDATVPCSVADVDRIVFNDPGGYSVNALYRDNSRGRLSFEGSVIGPFTIDAQSSDACDLSGWANEIESAASATGVNLASYSRRVYVMPDSACTSSGYGTMRSTPSRAWVFTCGIQGVYAHELGHNIGLDHASDATREFGDWTDPMAISTNQLRGLNAPHRHQLGWLASTHVLTLTGSGYYDIAPLSLDPAAVAAPQVLTIRRPDTGEDYYLSYRTSEGFDRNISGWYLDHRLSVHRAKADGSSTRTYLLAGLLDNERFSDDANGLTVTMIGHSATHATVHVELNTPCLPAAPLVGLSPGARNGPAGVNESYTLSVTNRDGSACSPSTLALSSVVPSGWQAALSTSSLTLGPGASGSAVITVTVPPDAAVSTHNIGIELTDPGTVVHETLASGSYSIVDSVAPSAPSGLSATVNQKQKRIDLAWSASSDNGAIAGYRILKNGVVVATAVDTEWTDGTWAQGATMTYSVLAFDGAGNASPPGGSVTVKLGGGGSGDGSTDDGGGGRKPRR